MSFLPARGGTPFFAQNVAKTESRVFVLTGSAAQVDVWEFDSTERALSFVEFAEIFNLDVLLVRANSLDSVKRNHAGWIAGREVVPPQ